MKKAVSLPDLMGAANAVAVKIIHDHFRQPVISAYGIPRGGIAPAYMVANAMHIRRNTNPNAFAPAMVIVDNPDQADIFIDDIIDSGATRTRYLNGRPDARFYALYGRNQWLNAVGQASMDWIVFPWEVQESGHDTSAEDAVTRILQYIGEDTERGGISETPARVVKALDEWFGGYKQDPIAIMKCFEDGAEKYDEMIVELNLPFYSHCEHHLAPFFGTVTVGYIPQGKIAGLSKIPRMIEVFARRAQVQERLTTQIADALVEALNPLGVGVITRARHMCMESRGVCKQGHHTEMSALRGVLKDKPEARAEFFSIAKP